MNNVKKFGELKENWSKSGYRKSQNAHDLSTFNL
jgi:hypothetical protein